MSIGSLRRRGLYQSSTITLQESSSFPRTPYEAVPDGEQAIGNRQRNFNSIPNGGVGHNSAMTLSGPTTTTTAAAAATTATTNINRTSTTKRSLSESSVEELQRDNEFDSNSNKNRSTRNMWRNELVIRSQSNKVNQRSCTSTNDSIVGSQKRVISDLIDVALRIAFVLIFSKLETMDAFKRRIHTEELWLYKNPRTPDIVSAVSLLITVIVAPFCVTLLHLILTRDLRDFRAANWVWTLALCFNGLATSTLKLTIGRPRPDFFYRCFPDGQTVLKNVSDHLLDGTFDMYNCTGNLHDINEGRKSFPSGHASFAFNSFGFIALYIGAKLHAFAAPGRGQTWRLCIALSPLYFATLIAVSRTCDYHHHWQDVLAGSLIGVCTTYLAYRQYYPSIFNRYCHRPFPRGSNVSREKSHLWLPNSDDAKFENIGSRECDGDERRPLICDDEPNNKWI